MTRVHKYRKSPIIVIYNQKTKILIIENKQTKESISLRAKRGEVLAAKDVLDELIKELPSDFYWNGLGKKIIQKL